MHEDPRVLLFQGDSITDADRERDRNEPNDARAMGSGYALLAMCRFLARRPQTPWHVYNRGVSGDKVLDLQQRWQCDTLALRPNILSILVGINDLWHKLDGRYGGSPEDYEQQYDGLLSRTRAELPEVKIVMGEPFLLSTGVVNERWFDEFEQRRAIAQVLASRHGAIWVPFHRVFDEAVANRSAPAYWAADGVHPTPQGHQLMAEAWCNAVC
jgi:lysophospholipase L1-like esterase